VAVTAARRRTDGDHDRVRLDDTGRLGGELQAALAHVRFDQFGQAGLEDRNLTAVERRDLGGVLIDAGDVMTEIGETGPRHEADIAGADHGHAHSGLR
jgi:hypothetical protein